jgi:hypothetical protein
LRDRVFYGTVFIEPIAPVRLFGLAHYSSHGRIVTSLLLIMVTTMLTAISYGRMSSVKN